MTAILQQTTTEELPASLHAADEKGAVYVTHHALDTVPTSLDRLKAIRSVVCAYVIKGQPPLLCVHWRSRDEFESNEAVLDAFVKGYAAAESRRGLMSGFVSNRRRWSVRGIVTGLFALLGVWQTLTALLHLVFQPGEVLVTAGRAGAINYFPEQQLFESFRITSRLPIEQTVWVNDVKLLKRNGGGKPLDVTFAPKIVKGLGTDQSETIQVSVALPEQPGEYDLVAMTQTKAGWQPGPKLQKFTMPLRIWSPVPQATFEGWADVQGDVATARYRLEVGYAAPLGLDCTATITGSPPDILAIISPMAGAHDAGDLVIAGEGDRRVVSQSWITRPFPDFAKTTVPIVFHAEGAVDWKRLTAHRQQLDCSPKVEDSRDV